MAEKPGCVTIPPDEETESDYGEGAGPRTECNIGQRSFVTIGNGLRAFLLEGPDYTSIEWVEPLQVTDSSAVKTAGFAEDRVALEIHVIGRSSELSGQEAVEIANRV